MGGLFYLVFDTLCRGQTVRLPANLQEHLDFPMLPHQQVGQLQGLKRSKETDILQWLQHIRLFHLTTAINNVPVDFRSKPHPLRQISLSVIFTKQNHEFSWGNTFFPREDC